MDKTRVLTALLAAVVSIVTGLVLLLAATVDAVSRRRAGAAGLG